MKPIKDLELGYADAENYKRRENKDLLNRVFIRDTHLDELCLPNVSFLIGEKGTGKTAYSIYLSNNNYKHTSANIRYVRETEYQKFISLKREKHLTLSDFSSIWKVILYLLLAKQVQDKEGVFSQLLNYTKFAALNAAIDEYYLSAFSPEIIQALSFVQESKLAAELLHKHAALKSEEKHSIAFSESRFQINLFYIQKKFEEAFSQIRLDQNHILFIDGIDIRPSSIPYEEYLECIKGLANAIWEMNNDFFPSIKGGKGRMRVVLLIRPDIFESIGLQNQNTKIRDNSVFLDWRTEYNAHRNSQLFEVVDHMLGIQQDPPSEKGIAWDNYFPWDSPNVYEQYSTTTSFINFLRWSYYRPRDIVTMLELLKANTNGDQTKASFSLNDFENSHFQREYSNYLLGEVKDHLSFYYGADHYEIFLKFFEYLSGKDSFNYELYLSAFEKLQEHIRSIAADKPKFMATPNDFLQFLFDLNVICYIEHTEDNKPFIHWCFKDRSYANISPKVKTGVKYQIFYGLAKALNVGKEFKKKRV
ncbi:P-loop ATPase, Sll1717 family [Shewanella sedimentimangrovi]|uniref:FunZ protein n=1 Tax=Shewanella sedimentimangrovi TaxID=2814293 RepID=A0ABX7QX72_9GAMM|nr:funZ protein [Shewanella sedimentimangrovi]QSX36106.1 funZ protein [Shewanella sedimentimangrovi]